MAFTVEYNENEKLNIVLSGDLDINTVEEFKKDILEKYKGLNKDIVFDLDKLDYIDSTGLGALISVYKEARDKDRKIFIINIKRNIRKLFIITELDQIFEMEE